VHTGDLRRSTILFHLTKRLLYRNWRDPNEDPKLHLFGQLKRITKKWLDECLVCKGGTFPAQLMYLSIADMACERISAAITEHLIGEHPIKAMLDPYNPTGSTSHVAFNTSKDLRWETDARKCHVNWAILDSTWEGEFCRVLEAHPKVKAYVKNYNLGFEVPYRYGSETRTYIPDFIVLIDDGHGPENLLRLVAEIKGYRREDARDKKRTMDTYWVPGVNHLKSYGRWAFAELLDVFEMESDLESKIEAEVQKMIQSVTEGNGK
jgi:type III restriction enzyme